MIKQCEAPLLKAIKKSFLKIFIVYTLVTKILFLFMQNFVVAFVPTLNLSKNNNSLANIHLTYLS